MKKSLGKLKVFVSRLQYYTQICSIGFKSGLWGGQIMLVIVPTRYTENIDQCRIGLILVIEMTRGKRSNKK